jgi:hypothetical protein
MWESKLASECHELFDEFEESVQDHLEYALICHGKQRYCADKADRAEHWLIEHDRRVSQCKYVREREAVDPEYREARRELSRELARETTARREDEAVREWNRTPALPGLVPGVDFPVPKKRQYRFNVDLTELRSRHAKQEHERRKRAKSHDSMPLLEVLSAQI